MLLLTLFVGGLIWFLLVIFFKIFLTNIRGKSIWPKASVVKEISLVNLQGLNNLQ